MITVSVCMITYGHENYIHEALNGILSQETNFEIELVIANDCSPDNTDAIINDIISSHPKGNLIKYTRHTENLGIMPNLLFAIEQCQGEYIAMCEGDDYWIDNKKLQKQVELIEADKNLGLVYTGVKFFNQSANQFVNIPPRFAKLSSEVIPKMMESKFIEFPTTLFRATVLQQVIQTIKPELMNAVIGDTRILLETAFQSEIHFLSDVTTVYRVAEGSASYPKDLDKYVFALMDTYQCRANFINRNNLDPKLLAYTICNTNKSLINKAFVTKNYKSALKLLNALLIKETFRNCNFNAFRKKMSVALLIKLLVIPFGVGVLKQKFKNES